MPRVATVLAAIRPIQPSIDVAGLIVPYQMVGVSSALAEPIVRVAVREGDTVQAGEILARLETDDMDASLAAAQRVVGQNAARTAQTIYGARASLVQSSTDVHSANAVLRQALVNLASARNDLRRDETLTAQGYLAQQITDQQRTVVVSDTAAVASARASLVAAQANAVANGNAAGGVQAAQIAGAQAAEASAVQSARQIERQIARATIVAPVDGVVVSVNANPGEYPSGRQLFTIERNDIVYAVLSATDADAFSIGGGAPASVTPHGSSTALHGKVTAVLDQVAPGSTNFIIKVLLENPQRRLHAGMPVRAKVFAPPVSGVTVPLTAFVDDEHNRVWTVENGRVRGRAVAVRSEDGTRAVVSGLASGSRVIERAQESPVADGDRVGI